jgi:hypothetical protein
MFYFVILINWRNKFSNYSTFTLKIYWTFYSFYWTFYSFYWSFWSILLCKINHFTERTLLANLFLKYWSFYPKYLAYNIVSLFFIKIKKKKNLWNGLYCVKLQNPFYNTGPRRFKYIMYMFIIVILLERTQKSFVSKYFLLFTYK